MLMLVASFSIHFDYWYQQVFSFFLFKNAFSRPTYGVVIWISLRFWEAFILPKGSPMFIRFQKSYNSGPLCLTTEKSESKTFFLPLMKTHRNVRHRLRGPAFDKKILENPDYGFTDVEYRGCTHCGQKLATLRFWQIFFRKKK